MKEPVADMTLLVLLILFFWTQQRSRPQTYFRYWITGWVLVLLSYLSWMLVVTDPAMLLVQDAARFDFLFLGSLTFLLSFLNTEDQLWRTVRRGAWVGIPVMLIIETRLFFAVPKFLLLLAILAWHVAGFWAARRLIPVAQRRRRRLLEAVCVIGGLGIALYVWNFKPLHLDVLAVSEVLFSTALLYWLGSEKRSLAAGVGAVGFMLWSLSYMLDFAPPLGPRASEFVGLFWNFPKDFVGFSMILKVFEDASAEKSKLVEQYRTLYEDFRLMFESHVHPMWICEPASDRFLSANTAAILEYGYSEAEFKQMAMSDLLASQDGPKTSVGQQDRDAGAALLQHRRKDGSLAWVELTTSWVGFQGKDARFVMARDATEEKLQTDDLFHRAHHDGLTGLPNRALLEERIRQCHQRCRQDGSKMMLVTVDVDHFKSVNDTFGHMAGDECLKAVAERLKGGIRDVDMLARTGGEEFTAVIVGLRAREDVEKVAVSLLQKFEQPLEFAGNSLAVTVSLGVAVYPDDSTSMAALSQMSDAALYAAKRGGRNRAAFAGENAR